MLSKIIKDQEIDYKTIPMLIKYESVELYNC